MSEPIEVGAKVMDADVPRREAIHVPIAVAMARGTALKPGQKIHLLDDVGEHVPVAVGAQLASVVHGVVDPFLTDDVQPGERFWAFITPGTTSAVMHVWSHPALRDVNLDPDEDDDHWCAGFC